MGRAKTSVFYNTRAEKRGIFKIRRDAQKYFYKLAVLPCSRLFSENPSERFRCGTDYGSRGYVESAMSGLMAGIYLERKLKDKKEILISDDTVSGALARYITTENKDFQPMNANFGIIPPLDRIIKDKKEKKRLQAERSLAATKEFIIYITED